MFLSSPQWGDGSRAPGRGGGGTGAVTSALNVREGLQSGQPMGRGHRAEVCGIGDVWGTGSLKAGRGAVGMDVLRCKECWSQAWRAKPPSNQGPHLPSEGRSGHP